MGHVTAVTPVMCPHRHREGHKGWQWQQVEAAAGGEASGSGMEGSGSGTEMAVTAGQRGQQRQDREGGDSRMETAVVAGWR